MIVEERLAIGLTAYRGQICSKQIVQPMVRSICYDSLYPTIRRASASGSVSHNAK